MIDIINLSVQFTGSNLFQNVNLKILENDKIALVGANGAGKSTLLNLIARNLLPEDGTIQCKKNIKIGYLPQEVLTKSENSVFNEVRSSIKFVNEIEAKDKALTTLLETTEDKIKLTDQYGELNNLKEESGFYEVDAKIKKILMGLGFNEEELDKSIGELSGGWQMRVELAKILVADNDIILLDEPTNHLDIDSLQWLIGFLKSYKGAIILVSHDRYFVNNICSKTLEIYNKNVTFFKGNYDAYLKFKEERDKRLLQEYQDQQKQIKQTEQFIERFRYKATKAKQVQSRIKQIEKIDRIELNETENKIHFKFFDTQPSGVIPIKLTKVSKAFGNNEVLKNIDYQFERGEKIALIGPNGAGKTTLAKLISHRLNPTSGKIEFGHNTAIAFYAQDIIDNLNHENDILTEIESSNNEYTTSSIRTILGAFLFHGEAVFKKIKILSGGEKSRVALAKVLLTNANTIILDEPTNHLDYNSKQMVQKALIEFSGTLIIVSHDIDFLRPIVTKVLEVRHHSLKEYVGGIDYYLSKRVDFIEQTSSKNMDKKITKKDVKRIEAEKRQKYYIATRDLKKKIELFEKKIEELEISKAKLDEEILKEEVYSNPEKAKINRQNFAHISNQLNQFYEDWTLASEELEKIDKSFDLRFY